jgi:hypothetical protein
VYVGLFNVFANAAWCVNFARNPRTKGKSRTFYVSSFFPLAFAGVLQENVHWPACLFRRFRVLFRFACLLYLCVSFRPNDCSQQSLLIAYIVFHLFTTVFTLAMDVSIIVVGFLKSVTPCTSQDEEIWGAMAACSSFFPQRVSLASADHAGSPQLPGLYP